MNNMNHKTYVTKQACLPIQKFGVQLFLIHRWKKMAWALKLACTFEEPLQGPLDVSVPQAIDEGVQHGGDHNV